MRMIFSTMAATSANFLANHPAYNAPVEYATSASCQDGSLIQLLDNANQFAETV